MSNCENCKVLTKEMMVLTEALLLSESGGKMTKKIKQVYGRQTARAADKRAANLYHTFEEHLRKRPWWIPEGAWKVIQRIVLVHYT